MNHSRPPVIFAFFQMNWFNVARGRTLEQLTVAYSDMNTWRDTIATTSSGKILKSVFKDLYDTIIWRMPNPGLKKDPSAELDYNTFYVREIIINHKPDIIIALGPSAAKCLLHEVLNFAFAGPVLSGKHPLDENALLSLVNLAAELRKELESYEVK